MPDKDVPADTAPATGIAAILPAWFMRWAPPATLAASLLSLLVHLTFIAIAAVIYVGGAQAGGAGGGAASFFGAEARGTRFAYICDISGSMDAGVGVSSIKRIDILKTELGKSLDSLLENAYFFVTLFSTDTKPLGGRLEWIQATDAGKQWQRRTVPLIQAEGSTEPVPAFKMVFSLRPKPDAIYFMTDGEFNEEYVALIARLNAEWRIPIHCITFVSREGEKIMRKIAADSGGTYTHFAGPGG